MKKLAVLLMIACIAMMPLSVFAEAEVQTITWEDVGEPALELLGLEGDFVALNEMGLAIWIPSDLEYMEPSEEDAAAGRYAIFMDKDQECALIIDTAHVDGMTLDQAYQNAVDSGMKEPEIVNVNGLDVVSYENEEINSGCIVLVDTNCNLIIFSFTPIDSDVAKLGFTVIGASLMPYGE